MTELQRKLYLLHSKSLIASDEYRRHLGALHIPFFTLSGATDECTWFTICCSDAQHCTLLEIGYVLTLDDETLSTRTREWNDVPFSALSETDNSHTFHTFETRK
jgi:hypothetical protein